MGSKRAMLGNGLGHLLDSTIKKRARFVDLFCGSGAVAGFVARRCDIPVMACDLQQYAVTLTNAAIARTETCDADEIWARWRGRARDWLYEEPTPIQAIIAAERPPSSSRTMNVAWVQGARDVCESLSDRYSLARAYGGYYYSSSQALTIEALRATVDVDDTISLAALIAASSRCAAAPGHTAQPFSTTKGSLPHLVNAWRKDVLDETHQALRRLASLKSRQKGGAVVSDAFAMTPALDSADMVFVDPPYSEVQYSRFYHVLEAICKGGVSAVSGIGRYPPLAERPQSKYCRTTTVVDEFDRLMLGIALSGAEALITFPAGESSNGLSGSLVEALSEQYFRVKAKKVSSIFSTLGGNTTNRSARQGTTELILHLSPK